MPPAFRLLAPLVLTAVAAASQAQYSGGFGVIVDTTEYSASPYGTQQYDGGKRHFEAEARGSTTYAHDYYGSAAGDAQAHGSIYTGTIGCATSGSSDVVHAAPFGTFNPPFVSTQAHALLWDGVTLAGENVVGRAIPVQLALDGFTVSSGWTATSSAEFTLRVYDFDFGKTIVSRTVYATGNTTLDALIPGGDARLYNGSRHLQISYELTTYSDLGFEREGAQQTGANFYNTLHFGWNLPPSVVLDQSTSGFFNPGQPQAVPEPAPLLALGVGAAGALRRRGRR